MINNLSKIILFYTIISLELQSRCFPADDVEWTEDNEKHLREWIKEDNLSPKRAEKIKNEILADKRKRKITDEFNEKLKQYGSDRLDELITMLRQDKDDEIKRGCILQKITTLGHLSQDRGFNSKIIDVLSEYLYDQNNGERYFEFLADKDPTLVSQYAKMNVLDNFNKKSCSSGMILLVGKLNIKEAEPKLRELLVDEKKMEDGENPQEGYAWPARCALARMGSKEDINRVIEVLKHNYYDKPHGSPYQSFPILTYVRQPETTDILIKYIFDDKMLMGIAPFKPICYSSVGPFNSILKKHPLMGEGNRFKGVDDDILKIMREWIKTEYSPYLIKSLSVLIDGRIVNTYVEEPPKKIGDDKPKEEVKEKPQPKQVPPKTAVKPVKEIKGNRDNSIYVYAGIAIILLAIIGAIYFITHRKPMPPTCP